MLKAKLLIGWFLISSTCLFAQSIYLEDLDDYLVMPDDLNLSFQEQSDFYIKKYNSFLDYFQKELNEYQAEIKRLKEKKRLSKKKKKYLQDLEDDITYWEAKIDTVGIYLDTWELFEEPSLREDLREDIHSGNCYDFYTDGKVYSSSEIELKNYADSNVIEWEERLPCRVKTRSKVVGQKWEKRRADKNCTSSNPEDCLVWCLVEKKEEEEYEACSKGFDLEEETSTCVRVQSLSVEKRHNRLKMIVIKTGKEIEVLEYKQVSCN